MYVAGIDVGSVAAKALILEKQAGREARVVGRAVLPTGWNSAEAGQLVLAQACTAAGIRPESVMCIVATGYGRISLPFADKSITEISCHARGASYLFPRAGIILDIGGQDSKVISLEGPATPDTGQAATVRDFLMNDKCAAGTGRFLQVLSGILHMSLEELSAAASMGKSVAISSMCAVFAETEIVGLLAQGVAPQDIAAGVFRAIARRMCGLATSASFAAILADELGVPVRVPADPQVVGALGAALVALDLCEKKSTSLTRRNKS